MRWEKNLVSDETTVAQAIEAINENELKILLIVNTERKLLGTITDGDIRRGVLKGVGLKDPVAAIMNHSPTCASTRDSKDEIMTLMRRKQHRFMPLVNEKMQVVGIELLERMMHPNDTEVVLMAGGLGTRLHPLTKSVPKPLLKVGSKPLLETIVSRFIDDGFRKFSIAVNYKSELIEQHFGDGSRWGVTINYLRENEPHGTAGALRLLPEMPSGPFLMMNGDILTNVKFSHLLDFHREQDAFATMCIREFDFQVPYGVVTLEGSQILGIDEKPWHSFFVNAGIYVLDPEVINLIPERGVFDMTNLFDKVMDNKKKAVAFPIREYWLDIGHPEDFKKAELDYSRVFE